MKHFMSCFTLLTIISFLTLSAVSQTNVGGLITANTMWNLTGSPYTVTNNILVDSGILLEIQPGVTVDLSAGTTIQVEGILRAIGTSSDPVNFVGDDIQFTNPAKLLITINAAKFDSATGTGCLLSYCDFEDVSIEIKNRGIEISDCFLLHSDLLLLSSIIIPSNPEINESRIINNILNECSFRGLSSKGRMLIRGNNFNNSLYTIYLEGIFTFENNCVVDTTINFSAVTEGLLAWSSGWYNGADTTSYIRNNTFQELEVAISEERYPVGNLVISNNSFEDNDIGILMNCESDVEIVDNNFLSFKDYNVKVLKGDCNFPLGDSLLLDLSNNYWGNLSNAQIDSSIYDYKDDYTVIGAIDYSPFLANAAANSNSGCLNVQSTYPEMTINRVEIQIFPNPFHKSTIIEIYLGAVSEDLNLKLFNIIGKQVGITYTSENFNGNAIRFELNGIDLQTGIYFYELSTGSTRIASGKIIRL
ncbi:MAG: T9SS type A sorting domain-containing protein [Bacteroidetes bacterium]|nr:T9SS type A sorting domain-containing protein [Bacteroidota bacterium]